jgi:triosephosphate isomerase
MKKNKLFVANWKMHKTEKEMLDFIERIKTVPSNSIYIAAPSILLYQLGRAIEGTSIKSGAQDFFYEDEGAYTGEICASMLLDAKVSFVIVGHSERRHYFSESNEVINKKLKKALNSNLTPILCIGETLDEKERHETNQILASQLEEGLAGIDEKMLKNIIIAYEPIWAIGTGLNATVDVVQKTHHFIKNWLYDHKLKNFKGNIQVLYGGSVNAQNIDSLIECIDVDGVLVGKASLNADNFLKIIN